MLDIGDLDRAHDNISERAADHSERRVSKMSPSMVTVRSKPGASA
jgi:hypothetical protein